MNSDVMVRQLAHLKQKRISDSSCKAIIVDTLLATETPLSKKSLLIEIHSLFQVLVTKERLQEVLDDLCKENVVHVDSDETVNLVPAKRIELLAAQTEDLALQQKAISNWLVFIDSESELEPELTNKLSAALPVFLRKLFIRHGVSSYELLTAAKNEFNLDVKEIAEEVSYPLGELYSGVVSNLLPTIFQHIDDRDICLYLTRSVKKAVGYLSEVVSKENYALLTASLDKLTLYLDTNVLYRLLHLQGDDRFSSISETLNFCKANNVALKISAETKKELSARLKFDARVLSQYPIKSDLARIGYAYRTSDNYVSTYWKQAQSTGVSVEDYNQYYQNFDILLEAEGITTESIAVEEDGLIDKAKDFFSKLSLRDRNHHKGDATLWHDAYSLAYVQKMQKADAKNALDTECLFLTTDQSIMALQREEYEFKDWPVIAIVPSQLLQMFAFTRPDEGYEETFIKFFASSSIGVSFEYSNEDIHEILSRISHYETKNLAVAQRILARELFNSRYKNASSDEEREEIVYKDISDELLRELNVSKEQIETLNTNSQIQEQELAQARATIEETKKNSEEDRKALNKQIENERNNTEIERAGRENAESKNSNYAAIINAQRGYVIDGKIDKWLKKKRWFFSVGLLLSIVIIFATVILTIKYGLPWLALLAAFTLSIPMVSSGAKAFSVPEKEAMRDALTTEYNREIEKRTKKG